MRLTLSSPAHGPVGPDVDVLPGLPAGQLRRRLAVLTGDAGWAAPGTTLTVAGRVLDDAHPAGAPPLLPGAHVTRGRPGHTPVDDLAGTLGTDAHLAVVAGPDAGHVLGLADGTRVLVRGPGRPGARRRPPRTTRSVPRRRPDHAGRSTLELADPALAGVVLEVRRRGRRLRVRRRGRSGGRGVDDLPAAVRRWPARAWRAGRPLRVGGTTLVVRGPGVARPASRRRARLPPWAWTTIASTSGAVALAVAMRQPLLLLTAGVGLLGLVAALRPPGAGGDGPPGAAGADAAPAPADAAAADVAALRVATARAVRGRPAPVPGDTRTWPADGTIALVGPRAAVLPVARAIALRALGAATATALVVRRAPTAGSPDDWSWTRWWSPSSALPGADADALVVADGPGTDLAAWRTSAGPHARLLLVVPEDAAPPAWVSTVVRPGVPGQHPPRRVHGRRTRGTPAGTHPGPPGDEGVSPELADAQARAAAALGWLVVGSEAARRPDAVRADHPAPVLGALPGVPAAAVGAVTTAWGRPPDTRRLVARLGVDPRRPAGEPVTLDLVRDGPHALVAGTTGAGKSELLTTLVLALALTHPPARLALLLVDFKGGTGLGPLAALPHVVDHVHDLDVATARRTLTGLRAEVRRREHVLAAAGRTDVADLDPDDPATPGRLVVVVDELRALVDDLPEAAATLARLAAQGRALGVHLVLATQRPAGAVPADLRANVNLRIALRVADEADSRDVLGVPDAAALDPASPGRALVRIGQRPATAVQVARARHGRAPSPVRLLVDASAAWCPEPATGGGAPDDVAGWVAACRAAATGLPGTDVPWTPGLPAHLPADRAGEPATGDGLLVAVADLPDEQRRADVRWRLDGAPLLVLGGPRSGRSTTLTTVGVHALHAGAHVHAIGLPDTSAAGLRAVADDAVGTLVGLDDPHRCLLLLDRLARWDEGAAPRQVLLVDGLDVLLDDLAGHARGLGADLLAALLRRPPAGVHVAACGPVVAALTRLLGTFPTRLVLPVADAALDPQAGVPAGLAGPRAGAGRAVATTPERTAAAQVVTPSPAAAPAAAGRVAPLRVARLPRRSLPSPVADRGRLGVGGDGGTPVRADVGRPLVVVGPPASGRTTSLRTWARTTARDGARVVLVTAAPGAPTEAEVGDPTAADVAAPEVVATGPQQPVELHPELLPGLLDDPDDTTVLLVDDLDELERRSPGAADGLERALRSGRPRVAAVATTTDHAATAFRGPVAAALRHGQVLVLDPHGPAAADLLGPGHALHADPAERVPGRGVLRRDRSLVRVQVDDVAG